MANVGRDQELTHDGQRALLSSRHGAVSIAPPSSHAQAVLSSSFHQAAWVQSFGAGITAAAVIALFTFSYGLIVRNGTLLVLPLWHASCAVVGVGCGQSSNGGEAAPGQGANAGIMDPVALTLLVIACGFRVVASVVRLTVVEVHRSPTAAMYRCLSCIFSRRAVQLQTMYCTCEAMAGAALAMAILGQSWGVGGFRLAMDNKFAALQGVAVAAAGTGVGLVVGLSASIGTSAVLPTGAIDAPGGLLHEATIGTAKAMAGNGAGPTRLAAMQGAVAVVLSVARGVGMAATGLLLGVGLLAPLASVAEHGLGAFVDLDAGSVLQTAEWSMPVAVEAGGWGTSGGLAGSMVPDGGTAARAAASGEGDWTGPSLAADVLKSGQAAVALEEPEEEEEDSSLPAWLARHVAGGFQWMAGGGFWMVQLAVWPIVAAANTAWVLLVGTPQGLLVAVCSLWLMGRQAVGAAVAVGLAGQLASTMLEERLTRSARFEQMLDGVFFVGEQPVPNRSGLARTTMHPQEGRRALDVAVEEAYETFKLRPGTGKVSAAWRQWRCLLATGEDYDTFMRRRGGREAQARGRGGRSATGRQVSSGFLMDHGRANLREVGAVVDAVDADAATAQDTVRALLQRLATRPPLPLNPPTAWLARGLRLYRASCLGIGPGQLDRSSLLLLAAAQARPGSIAQFSAHYQPWQGLDETDEAWDKQITQLSEAHVNATNVGRKRGTLSLLLWQQRLRASTAVTYAREVGLLGRPSSEAAFDPASGRRLRHRLAVGDALGRYAAGPLDWAWLGEGEAPPWLLLAREHSLAHLDRLLPTSKPLRREILGDASGNRQRALVWIASGIVDAQAVAADAAAVSVQAPSMARFKSRQARLGGPRVCRSLPGAAGRAVSSTMQRVLLESGPLDVVLEQARWLRRAGLTREQAQEDTLRQHRLDRRTGVIADRFWATMASVPVGWFMNALSLCGTAVRSCSPLYCCLFPAAVVCRSVGGEWGDLFCHAGAAQPAQVMARRCARPAVRRMCCMKDDSAFPQRAQLLEGAGRQAVQARRRDRRGRDAGRRGSRQELRWVEGQEARQRHAVRQMLDGDDYGRESDQEGVGERGERKSDEDDGEDWLEPRRVGGGEQLQDDEVAAHPDDEVDLEEEAWRDLDDFDLDPTDDWADYAGNQQVAKAAGRADFGSVLLSVMCCCGCRGGLGGMLGAAAAWADSVLIALNLSKGGVSQTLNLQRERYRRVNESLRQQEQLDRAGRVQNYATATMPEHRDRVAVRRVAEWIRGCPPGARATVSRTLRAFADIAWDALDWAGIRKRSVRREPVEPQEMPGPARQNRTGPGPVPLQGPEMDSRTARELDADDAAFGGEMRASRAAVSRMRHGQQARGVNASASRFGGFNSQAMQAVIGGTNGLARSKAAFGGSAAASGADALAAVVAGANGAMRRRVLDLARSYVRGEPTPAAVPAGGAQGSPLGRTLGVEAVDARDLGATPLPQRTREQARGADGLRGLQRSMLGAGGAVGSLRVGSGLNETMGVGMGVETTYGLYGGSQSTLRQVELEDAAVRPEDIVEERSWREYGIAAPAARALRRTPADRASAILYDHAAVKHSVRVLQHLVQLAADDNDTSGAILELAPAAIASVLNAHLALRRYALSPAFRGNTVPITDTAGIVLLGLDPELLDLLRTTEEAARAIAAAFRAVTGESLPLPGHLRHALGRILGARGFVKSLPLPTQAEAKLAADEQAGGQRLRGEGTLGMGALVGTVVSLGASALQLVVLLCALVWFVAAWAFPMTSTGEIAVGGAETGEAADNAGRQEGRGAGADTPGGLFAGGNGRRGSRDQGRPTPMTGGILRTVQRRRPTPGRSVRFGADVETPREGAMGAGDGMTAVAGRTGRRLELDTPAQDRTIGGGAGGDIELEQVLLPGNGSTGGAQAQQRMEDDSQDGELDDADMAVGRGPLSPEDVGLGARRVESDESDAASDEGRGKGGGVFTRGGTPTRRAARRVQHSSHSRGRRSQQRMRMGSPLFDEFDSEVESARTPPSGVQRVGANEFAGDAATGGASGNAAAGNADAWPGGDATLEEFSGLSAGDMVDESAAGPPDDLVQDFSGLLHGNGEAEDFGMGGDDELDATAESVFM